MFLTKIEEDEVISAIKTAELNTSGEICIHIEKTSNAPHNKRALEVFNELNMFKTKQRNAVLIYIATDDHKFVIYGDEGINSVVPHNFWDSTKEVIQKSFKQGNFKQGIINGILKISEELKSHFPWQEDDVNELPNIISKG